MIRRFFRALAAVLLAAHAVVFSFVSYGARALPDSFNADDSLSLPAPFSAVSGPEESCDLRLLRIIPVKTVSAAETTRQYVHLGGELVGLRLQTKGVTVVGVEAFESQEGTVSPAEDAGIRVGDVLLSVDGAQIGSNQALADLLEKSGGKTVEIRATRGGKDYVCRLKPRRTAATGAWKGGVWVRDSTAGIGTLTFSDVSTGRIATLGHPVFDSDTGEIMPVRAGGIFTASVSGVTKGTVGAAGEILGRVGETQLGTVDVNGEQGVYGDLISTADSGELTPVALPAEVREGPATVICTVTDGEKRSYDISIERISHSEKPGKDMTVRVTDPALLDLTGGIVQGMSGAPIVQNGMLVGAVTHVFVSDPKTGYAIFAGRMTAASRGGGP